MILLIAVLAGLIAGLTRAFAKESPYQLAPVRYFWLVFIAFIPQWLVFFLPATRAGIPQSWVPWVLISSQIILIGFAWLNRKSPGFWALMLGCGLNLLVMALNGGWMPILPETLIKMGAPESTWQLGARHGFSKDMVLTLEQTRLWFLGDVMTLKLFSLRVAFSAGDVFIALGTMLYLATIKTTDKLVGINRSKQNDKRFSTTTGI